MPKFEEIKELYKYCKEIGVRAELITHFDGYVLCFARGDFAQHSGTHASRYGLIEPNIRCKYDFNGVTLEDAKRLVWKYRNELNGKKKEQ